MNAETPVRADAVSPDPVAAPQDAERALVQNPEVAAAERSKRRRKRLFLILGAVVLLAALGYLGYRWFFAGANEVTDDAYVAGDVVDITSREQATVTAIYADNTQRVSAGQPLIDFDPADADAAMASAEAQLAQAVRSVRSDLAKVGSAGAEITSARADLSKAKSDLARRRDAAREGAVSAEEVAHAADSVRSAEAALALAQSRQTEARSSVAGTSVENNPDVLAAIAAVRRAALVRGHMRLVAPVGGVIAQRSVQVGQQVAPGKPLMAIVPLDAVWVDANFRETQLADLRIGQPVTIKSDIYGGDVVFHGKVAGLSAGSGSAFALLPAQNASGNWIKITQRLPVRIALDPAELRRNPLQVGLSVTATVDTANAAGTPVARAASTGTTRRSAITRDNAEVNAGIARIIAANRGDAR